MPHPARAASSGKPLPAATAAEAPLRLLWVAPLALLLAWLLSLTPAYQRLSQALVDSQLQLALRDTPRNDVAVVDIDEASIRALRAPLGAWPYRRDTYALLADHLLELGARLVVFDIVFADARDGDAVLARSIERSGRVLLAAARCPRLPMTTPARHRSAARCRRTGRTRLGRHCSRPPPRC